MWLFVLSMGGSKISQGIAIASFSSGRVLFSPILGRLSDTHGHRRVLVVSNIIISVGAFIYSAAPSFFFLALGQLVMGSGSAR
jgi:predicted MFS family arabinose efflux permease